MKKLLSAILASAMLLSTIAFTASSVDLTTAVEPVLEAAPAENNGPTTDESDPNAPKIDFELETPDLEKMDVVSTGNYDGYWFASSYTSPYITYAKNQGAYGTCWAHAACKMAEANLLMNGLASSTIDLSEAQLAYFMYRQRYDPLGNTTGDYTTYTGSNTFLNAGSNSYLSSLLMASWTGLTHEVYFPYSSLNDSSYYATSRSYESSYRLTDSRWFNMSDIKAVKNYIIENGAVISDFYYDDAYYKASPYPTHYNPYQLSQNHAITIVGWDDNFSASNFKYNPGKNGAWLAQNSWGTSWGSNGYFWISYYDQSLSMNPGFSMEFAPSTQYENNYQYDGSCGYQIFTANNNIYFANTFTVNAYAKERLDAVMFALDSTNVTYTIQVYKNVTDFTTMNGTPLLDAPLMGTTTEAGIYTIPMGTSSILLNRGDTITVCIKFTSSNGGTVNVLVDNGGTNAGTHFTHVNNLSRDRSYVGVDWSGSSTGKYFYNMSDPYGDYKCTARIKALTTSMGDDGYILQVGSNYYEAASGSRWNITTPEFYLSNNIGYRFNYWSASIVICVEDVYKATTVVSMPSQDLRIRSVYYAVGDVNNDQKINARDKAEVTNIIKGLKYETKYSDVNGDGKTNARDKAAVTGVIKGTYIPTA